MVEVFRMSRCTKLCWGKTFTSFQWIWGGNQLDRIGKKERTQPIDCMRAVKNKPLPLFFGSWGPHASLWFFRDYDIAKYGNLVLSQPVWLICKYEGLDQSHSCALNFPARGAKSVKTDMGSVLAVAKEDVYIGRATWKLHWMELPSWQWFHDACPE